MTDLEFIQKCVKGDKQSWDEFVDKYSRLIYNYIYSVLNSAGSQLPQDNISDIFQEIFLSLVKDNFKKLKSFQGRNGCSLASWLRQVAVNRSIDYLRRLKIPVSLDEDCEDNLGLKEILADDSLSVKETLTQDEKSRALKDCIERLDNNDKYFLKLHIHKGLKLEELKRHFKLSRPAIDMRKSRIIERLRDCFKGKGFLLDF